MLVKDRNGLIDDKLNKNKTSRRQRFIRFIIIVSLVVLVLLAIFWQQQILRHTSKLEVVFLEVGQGDATLLKLPDKSRVLVDGGPDNVILHRLGEELFFYERRLDFLVVSHFHDDHIAGFIEIMRRYRVGALVYAAGLEAGVLGEILLEEAKRLDVDTIIIEGEGKISFSASFISEECILQFFNPLALGVKPDSNNSLLTKLNCASLKFLFAGDNEEKTEAMLLSSDFDLRADIFKASHHGSKTSNRQDFLGAINPKIMVIPVGENNKFNHPSQETLLIAENLDIEIRRTDKEGTIRFRINLANIK